jgi:hypothetical protein
MLVPRQQYSRELKVAAMREMLVYRVGHLSTSTKKNMHEIAVFLS